MRITAILASIVCAGAIVAAQAEVTKQSVPGIVNFAKVETTVACAGATTPAALVEVKRMGYASVINLRQATEPGVDIEASAAAAKAAGLNYIHIPFNAATPDASVVVSRTVSRMRSVAVATTLAPTYG